jgi:protein-tyrosine kinase
MIIETTVERLKKERAAQGTDRHSSAERLRNRDEAAADPARPPAPIRWLGHQPCVQLDFEKLRAMHLYPPPEFTRRIQNEYRGIRREVIAASFVRVGSGKGSVGPIVVVTSALPGDGKSYTALNLALSLTGEAVHDVLLIDGDFVKRSISTACGAQDRPGLMELLAKPRANFFEYVYATSTSRLYLLPAGTAPEGTTDLCSSGRVRPLFESIRSALAGHFVIVDTPPILSSDTPVLTDTAGQVLLVVRAGHTLQDSVKDAVSLIRDNIPVGVVLNAWSPLMASEKKAYTAFSEYAK